MLEVNAIHIDIMVLTGQGSVAPDFDIDISLFVQLIDGGGRYLVAPEGLDDDSLEGMTFRRDM